ncbi:MAG: hypothetical protein Fur0041_00500 [Bacteroidia bacterium]
MKKVLSTLAIAGIVIATLPSCKHQGGCDAYQGSHKSTRSHKKKHHAVVPAQRSFSNIG